MEKRQKQVSGEDQVTITRKSIPIDIVISIFSRLPVKSIARFRCLSKQWGSILHRRDFTDLFLRISLTRLCLLFTFQVKEKWHFFSAPQHHNSSLLAPDGHMTFPGKVGVYRMSHPVCGLLCGIPRSLFICNPSTGQYKTLPDETSMGDGVLTTYFGYDPIDKLFKVLRIFNDCLVLTLGTAKLSWRRIECSMPHTTFGDGICINGTLYYLGFAKDIGIRDQVMLVSFDIKLEKFKFMPVSSKLLVSALINFKGKLGAVFPAGGGRITHSYDRLTSRIEMWVLDDAENQNWSKHIYVLPSSWENLVGNELLYVVGMNGTDEIVFSSYHARDPFYIFYYNLVRNTLARVEIQFGMEVRAAHVIHTFIDHVQDLKLMEELESS